MPGRVVAGVDPLHEGPTPSGPDGARWIATRAEFIAGRGWATRDEARARLAEYEDSIAAAADADEVVLWFEHDLHCQLMLVRTLARLAAAGPGAVSLVAPGDYLADADAGALFEARRPVAGKIVDVAVRAWSAFTASDPTALLTLDTRSLPDLGPALRRHLEQFPASANGLARTERAILGALADGPRARRELFERARAAEETPYMGDTIFWDYLERLERGPAPLVVEDDTARLTADGHDVHAGRADAIDRRGIDRWLGGVHLMSPPAPHRQPVWRWNTRTLVRE